MLPGSTPPLTPSPDDARDDLRRELIEPQYNDQDVLRRLLDWVQRRIDGTIESASALPALTWLAVTVVVVALLAALALLLSQARFSARRRADDAAVLTGDAVTAAELRARAERALEAGRHGEAVVDGFRALAVHQLERGRLDDTPGSTAREVAAALAEQHPEQRARLDEGARLFDAVMYGERPATRAEAEAVLAIDASLRAQR